MGGLPGRRDAVRAQSFGQFQVGVQALLPHPAAAHRPEQVPGRGQRDLFGGASGELRGPREGEAVAAEERPRPVGSVTGRHGLHQPQGELDLAEQSGPGPGVFFGPRPQCGDDRLVPAAAVTHGLLPSSRCGRSPRSGFRTGTTLCVPRRAPWPGARCAEARWTRPARVRRTAVAARSVSAGRPSAAADRPPPRPAPWRTWPGSHGGRAPGMRAPPNRLRRRGLGADGSGGASEEGGVCPVLDVDGPHVTVGE